MSSLGRVIFGGPDLRPGQLRDLLEDHVNRAPPGSRIDWATYYFRDRALARALMRASDRGVSVRLIIEPRTRRMGANGPVIAMLKDHRLGGGLRLYSPASRRPGVGRLHAKIYAFSEPDIAWVGSFNPSGDQPEDAEVIAEIGDQDRGDNLLLGIERPDLVQGLRSFIDQLAATPAAGWWTRLPSNRSVGDEDTRIYFYPRLMSLVAEPGIAMLGRSGSVRGAISHLKAGPMAWSLALAARKGADIDLLVHDTSRRVSRKVFEFLRRAGVRIERVTHPESLPMHAKFLLVSDRTGTTAWLGSYNYNEKSRLLNAELLLATSDQQVVEQLSGRFEQIRARLPTGATDKANATPAAGAQRNDAARARVSGERRFAMADQKRDPHSDADLIDDDLPVPSQSGSSGGGLQREIGSADDEQTATGADPKPTSVHKSQKPRGGDEPNLPNRTGGGDSNS